MRLGPEKYSVWVMAIKILFYENHYFIYLPQTLPPLTDIHAHTFFLKPNSIFLLESQILPAYSGYTDLLCPNPTEMRNHECSKSITPARRNLAHVNLYQFSTLTKKERFSFACPGRVIYRFVTSFISLRLTRITSESCNV